MKSILRRKNGFYTQLLAGARDPVVLSKTAFIRGVTRIVSQLTGSVKLRFVVDSESGIEEYRVRVKFQQAESPRKGGPAIKVGRVIHPIDLDSISVHCTCSDYRFTFHDWLKAEGHSAGWFTKQVEAKGDRPPRAVKHAGCCKHVAGVIKMLEENVIVKFGEVAAIPNKPVLKRMNK